MASAKPIATAPRDGRVVLVADDTGTVTVAFWHGTQQDGIWAYVMPEGSVLVHQLAVEPTMWAPKIDAFLNHFKGRQPA